MVMQVNEKWELEGQTVVDQHCRCRGSYVAQVSEPLPENYEIRTVVLDTDHMYNWYDGLPVFEA